MLTTIVLTHNEEKNIQACLDTLSFSDQILVIDDNSKDLTTEIAKQSGAKVINHNLDGDFSKQRNFALSQVKSGWVLFIDADERVSKSLAKEITTVTTSQNPNSGYFIFRRDYMWGKALLHGDTGQKKLLRLAKLETGKWVYPVHEEWKVTGAVSDLNHKIDHYPHQTLYEFLKEINSYSSLRATQFFKLNKTTNFLEIIFGPIWRFFENYILKQGFLDGTVGFVHAMCMAFYMFLVSGKLWLLLHSHS